MEIPIVLNEQVCITILTAQAARNLEEAFSRILKSANLPATSEIGRKPVSIDK